MWSFGSHPSFSSKAMKVRGIFVQRARSWQNEALQSSVGWGGIGLQVARDSLAVAGWLGIVPTGSGRDDRHTLVRGVHRGGCEPRLLEVAIVESRASG